MGNQTYKLCAVIVRVHLIGRLYYNGKIRGKHFFLIITGSIETFTSRYSSIFRTSNGETIISLQVSILQYA